MILAHKIALDPTRTQEAYFRKAVGTARFVYNWALTRWEEEYRQGIKSSGTQLKKEFNKAYRVEFPWVSDVHRDCHSQPFSNLQNAYTKFFKHEARHPKLHKRGRHDSFYVANDKFYIEDRVVTLPVIGSVRLRESLRFHGKIMSGTVSREADRWYLSVSVNVDYRQERVGNETVGIDVGLKTFAKLSSGEAIIAPKPLRKQLKRLKRAQRALSRRLKGGQNRKKQQRRVARLHARIRHIRQDFLHKLSTRVCRENQTITIEDLNVKGMMQNHKLAFAISDAAWSEFGRQLKYKSEIYHNDLVIADRWMPSSKTCSRCGSVRQDLTLSDRVYVCAVCGLEIDRDHNAAIPSA
jgi:putative transposase